MNPSFRARTSDDDVASPCISVCKMDPKMGDTAMRAQGGLCVGCLRTMDEIIAWGGADAETRRTILTALGARHVYARLRP